jgi:hypothetical protein
MNDQSQLFHLNGVDAITGQPLISPISREELAQRVQDALQPKVLRRTGPISYKGPFDPVDPVDRSKAGWGLLVHADEAEAMQEYLEPLLRHRNGRILLYHGEDEFKWVEKNNAGIYNPNRFPYYTLIAGSPTKVPYDLQFLLDANQAVGRIHFDDPADYARYAQMVVDQETGQAPRPGKRVVFFAPRRLGDEALVASSVGLVRPLLKDVPKAEDLPAGLEFESLGKDEATKNNLLAALEADESGQTPAVLFSASHGAGLTDDTPYKRELQGSLMCQDVEAPLTRDQRKGWISGHDVTEGFQLPGGIHFLFACYGAGTRADSDFVDYVSSEKDRKALKAYQGKEDFVAYLPKALLANPQGGALAMVGHVDPAWTSSFTSPVEGERRVDPFGFTLVSLLLGEPVGHAVKAFYQKLFFYNQILADLIEEGEDPESLAKVWLCRNDTQNYVIIGDPAVRLSFG